MTDYEISGINIHSYGFVVNLIKTVTRRAKYHDNNNKCYQLEKFEDCSLIFSTDKKIDIEEIKSSLATCDKGLVLKVL